MIPDLRYEDNALLVDGERHHFGRSFGGPQHLEEVCPCKKAACGLVEQWHDDCQEHPPERMKTMRSGHLASDCPALCRQLVDELGFEKGHHWRPIPGGQVKDSAALVCRRCGENGWRVQ